jgi:hypothetical protein
MKGMITLVTEKTRGEGGLSGEKDEKTVLASRPSPAIVKWASKI